MEGEDPTEAKPTLSKAYKIIYVVIKTSLGFKGARKTKLKTTFKFKSQIDNLFYFFSRHQRCHRTFPETFRMTSNKLRSST